MEDNISMRIATNSVTVNASRTDFRMQVHKDVVKLLKWRDSLNVSQPKMIWLFPFMKDFSLITPLSEFAYENIERVRKSRGMMGFG